MTQRRTVTRRSQATGRKRSGTKKASALELFIDKLRIYKELTAKVKSANEQQDILRGEVTEYLLTEKDDKQIKEGAKVTVAGMDTYGARHQATLVEPMGTDIDKDGLHDDPEMTEELWEMCHERRFSPQRLEDLVARGMIKQEVAQKYIKRIPKAPYPKIS